jgi:hypothetical protein
MQKLQDIVADNELETENLNCCSRCKKIASQKSHLFPDAWQLSPGGQEEKNTLGK